ncbi:hypothetical protein ACN47E_009164 [Coniothyrium glycines]
MVNQRLQQFPGTSQFGAAPRPGTARPLAPALPNLSRAAQMGIGLSGGKGSAGLGKGVGGHKRYMKIRRDTIRSITKSDIRRLARRGGVKRISATIYDDVRQAMKARLTSILKEVVAIVELGGRTTVSVTDIVFILNRQGHTLYGYDPAFLRPHRGAR